MTVEDLDGWSISNGLFQYVREHFPDGSTILELGSGDGSAALAEHYEVYSVEHDEAWLNKHEKVNYLYAPIKDHKAVKKLEGTQWYDWSKLRPQLEEINYELIIVDGPPICIGRAGFKKYFDQLPIQDVPIIFDDLHRKRDLDVALKVSAQVRKPLTIHDTWEEKVWGAL
jgi:hypothetical protein